MSTRPLHYCCAILLSAPWAYADPPTLVGQQAQVLKKLSLEELMEIDVTSVSRRPERVRAAPAAVSVVASEEIRRSGAMTLADALRLADGLTVARFDAGTWAISARGFSNTVVNKMLVLIDGHSIYTPLFGGVFWDAQDTMLADIDRIEAIRGPAGTLWGANAVNGVINIITKSSAATQGGLLCLGTGTREHGRAAVRYGGRLGTGTYRVYGRSLVVDSPRRADRASAREDRRMHQAGFRADWGDGLDGPAPTLQGDGYYGARGLVDRPDLDFWGANLLGRWQRSLGPARTSVDLAAFYNVYDNLRTQEPTAPLGVPLVLMNKLDATAQGVEASASFQPHERWLLHGGYAFLDLSRELDPDSRDASGGFESVDPTHQIRLRSYLDLGGGVELDAFFRHVSALSDWEVPAYAELDARLGWRNERLDVSLIGRDLLHDQHPEFGAPGPGRREFQREVAARVTLHF